MIKIMPAAREEAISQGKPVPAELQGVFESTFKQGNALGQSARKRAAWTKGAGVPVRQLPKEPGPVEYLFYVEDYWSYHPRGHDAAQACARILIWPDNETFRVNTIGTYNVIDGLGGTGTSTLTITVTGTNDAPIAVVDTGSVTEAGIVAGSATATGNVLTNDTDVDSGDTKTVSLVNGATGNVGATLTGAFVEPRAGGRTGWGWDPPG